ncbi:IgaA/UmoB family intracellular growth attenuator [Pantoea sp. 1.19]|uniref:IgaA/UmoB family intracellular growth attenuator n=1 Tax=Pantoea sp. 1.19 TaxID=1925589 RepID=UPI0009488D50|nr:IgaA/UmoB family intracellular growth attenuator [Pantoea sp. 1.19]
MTTLALIFAILAAVSLAAGALFWYAMRQRPPLSRPLPFISPPWRKLTSEEREAVERYVTALATASSGVLPGGASKPAEKLVLTSQSQHVYPVTRAITRYGLSTDEPHKWRYYLDEIEVHLPPQWEQYITDENYVEIIRTQTMPLVISLNGHSLVNYAQEQAALPGVPRAAAPSASIRQEESEHVDLLRVRRETPEEMALRRPEGTREALAACAALLLFFCALLAPAVLMPWLLLIGSAVLAVSLASLWRPLREKSRRDIHCLRGSPKRWGLFGESNQGQMNTVSLGIMDLIYPAHWQPWVGHDLGQQTEIDIYPTRHVVRQGRFLSLQDEVRNFPLQRWRKNRVLALGSLLVLVLLIVWVPLGMPLKLSAAWLKGSDRVEVTSVDELEKTPLRVGDLLSVQGTGMCSVPASYQHNRAYAFMPFDCSAIWWNNARPLPAPQSDVIDKAAALLTTTRAQLHPPSSTDPKINPQLASAIQKSGMTLLDDFADIVLRAQELCSDRQDCVRLKNALVNLGNAKDWEALVKRADSGALNGTNVLLRPVSAEALENLVNTATSAFFYRETHRAAEALNSPPPGGFLIYSDEGRQLVSQQPPTTSLYDLNPLEQWRELQRLSGQLLHTPFAANGIITSLSVDANGTRQIAIHSAPDTLTLGRYIGTALLLALVTLSLIINSILALVRLRRDRLRQAAIQHYYEKCFNQTLTPVKNLRSLF